MMDQNLKKKDNIVKSLEKTIERLVEEKKENGVFVVEKFILEPTEWNMKFQREMRNREKIIDELKFTNS
jgi:uncharacterized membrane-anchored protein